MPAIEAPPWRRGWSGRVRRVDKILCDLARRGSQFVKGALCDLTIRPPDEERPNKTARRSGRDPPPSCLLVFVDVCISFLLYPSPCRAAELPGRSATRPGRTAREIKTLNEVAARRKHGVAFCILTPSGTDARCRAKTDHALQRAGAAQVDSITMLRSIFRRRLGRCSGQARNGPRRYRRARCEAHRVPSPSIVRSAVSRGRARRSPPSAPPQGGRA